MRWITLFGFMMLYLGASAQEVEESILVEVRSFYKQFHEGEIIFETDCAGCHGLNEASIAVGLSDVHTKRSREWLLEFLQRPSAMQYRLDEETQEYIDEYGVISHVEFKHLKEEDFADILDFVASEINGPQYDRSKPKEEYFVQQKNQEIKVGDYKFYFPDGKLSHHYYYNNGLPWNVVEVYDRFGEQKDGGTLHNGTGTIKTYDKYGNKETITTYVKGFRSGEYKQYFDGGQLELLGFYSNGKANGQWSYYYPSGEIKTYINYRNGRIISSKVGGPRPGFSSSSNTGGSSTTSVVPSQPISKPFVPNKQSSSKATTIIYPYNTEIKWESYVSRDPAYSALGNEFVTQLQMKKEQEIYLNATPGFRKFHPPSVIEQYVKDLNSYGKFEYYSLEKVGLSKVNYQDLALLQYTLTFTQQEVKMYLSFLKQNGAWKLDGWSYELISD